MITLRRFSFIILVLAALGNARAQLVTNLQLSKTQYLSGEPIIAQITVTNHAGTELTFQDTRALPWLDFVTRNANGTPVNNRLRAAFKPLKIAPGQTRGTNIDLSQLFLLTETGNYSVNAMVRNSSAGIEGVSTNRVFFSVSPGRAYWTQKVGVLGKPGNFREYRLLNFNAGEKSELFAQITDDRTGKILRTFSLGEALLIRKPMTTVDNKQHMHVLYLGTPTMWVHYQIDIDGKVLTRQIHQRGAQGDPQLLTMPDGTVRVGNGILYDPKAADAAKAKNRKASQRPAISYE
ncbi:MAG: hypothetical protein QM680_11290 [Luteolibacter sp.]